MNIDDIVAQLLQNNVVILPTETVYGIASFEPTKLYLLKSRPYSVQLPIMYASVEQVLADVECNLYQERAVYALLPGPFTLILYNRKRQKVAIRVPEHDCCVEILKKLNRPIFVTSANIHGQTPATDFMSAKSYFPNLLGIDCGESRYKQSSMIIDLTASYR